MLSRACRSVAVGNVRAGRGTTTSVRAIVDSPGPDELTRSRSAADNVWDTEKNANCRGEVQTRPTSPAASGSLRTAATHPRNG